MCSSRDPWSSSRQGFPSTGRATALQASAAPRGLLAEPSRKPMGTSPRVLLGCFVVQLAVGRLQNQGATESFVLIFEAVDLGPRA